VTSDNGSVFGISLGTWANKDFGFVEVLATVQGDDVIPVDNPKDAFPTEGNIYVSEQYWVPPIGGAAVYRVRETGSGKPGVRHAHFSAIAKGQPGPLEIIPISARSTDAERVRRLLLSGWTLGFGPGRQVLLKTTDGRIMGPVRVEPRNPEVPQSILSRPDAFLDPLGLWRGPEELGTFEARWHGQVRTFASSLHLPPPSSFVDCMELGDCTRLVLKFVSSLKLEGLDFTKKQIEALSSALSQDSTPSRVGSRAERVIAAMKDAVRTGASIEELTTFLLESDVVKQLLSKIEEEAREAEDARLAGQSSEAKQHLAALQARETAVRQELHRLEGQLRAIEKKGPASVDRLTARLLEGIGAFEKNPPDAIANLALVKQLSRRSTPHALSLQQVHPTSPSTEAGTLSELLAGLEDGFRSLALVQGAAKLQAREVAAAALAGQFVVFRGSLASIFAEFSATTFGGENTWRVSIPVGLLNGLELEVCVGRVLDHARAKGSLTTLILDNLNLSAFEVYGLQLHDIVARRQFSNDGPTPPLLLFGSLASGGAALPVATTLLDIGPVFSTDVVAFSQSEASVARRTFKIQAAHWDQWRRESPGLVQDTERVVDLQDKLANTTNSLWKRTTNTACRYLTGLGLQAPLQSLAFGWLIPRATVSGGPAVSLPAELAEGLLDGESPDQRIIKLLRRSGGVSLEPQ
jgi:hypothetical protein